MSAPWEPERVVSTDDARGLIRGQFPELPVETIEPFGVGWDNTVYLVDRTWVFRFPRRQIAVDLIRTEARVLPRIAPELPLAVPVPVWVGEPDGDYPWPFAGYRLLPGRTGCVARLDAEQRAAAAEPLGRFLAALHAIAPDGLALPDDEIRRADMSERTPMLLERIETLHAKEVLGDTDRLRRLIEEARPRPPVRDGRLVHGDLYARHLLVDDVGTVCGVIDWGDVHRGDAAVDLAIAIGFLPPAARPAFFAAYGPVDGDTMLLARLRALFHGVAITSYGHDVGDAALLREGLIAIDYVLARE